MLALGAAHAKPCYVAGMVKRAAITLQVLEGNVRALTDAQPLPYKSSSGGAASSLSQSADSMVLRGPPQAGPRDHA
jgi:hypothetical protein